MPLFFRNKKMKYFTLATMLLFSGLFASELQVEKMPEPPMLVIDKEQKKVVRGRKKHKRKDGWHFVGGVFGLYGRTNSGGDNDDILCFPLIGASYSKANWEVGTQALGVAGKYTFLDGAIETYLVASAGWKRERETSSDGYAPGVINDAKFKAGVGAYYFRADYTYAPVKMIHPPIKNQSLDVHFWEIALESPGVPIMIKPRFCGLKAKLRLSMMDDNFAKAYFNYYDSDGNATYIAKGGLHSFSYSLSSNLIISKKWMFLLNFKREYYLGDASASPVVHHSTGNTVTSLVMYRF